MRVDFEDRSFFRPGVADELVGCSPSQSFQVFGEIVGGDEGQDMGLQAFQVVIMVGLHRGVLDRAIHPLGLTVGPWVVGLDQPVLDVVFEADAAKDLAAGGSRDLGYHGTWEGRRRPCHCR